MAGQIINKICSYTYDTSDHIIIYFYPMILSRVSLKCVGIIDKMQGFVNMCNKFNTV